MCLLGSAMLAGKKSPFSGIEQQIPPYIYNDPDQKVSDTENPNLFPPSPSLPNPPPPPPPLYGGVKTKAMHMISSLPLLSTWSVKTRRALSPFRRGAGVNGLRDYGYA